MTITLASILFLVGILLIIKGGSMFVDAATWMARASGIPQFIIGATIVSIATTMPEMIVSIMAAAEGGVDMAIGNAVGSVAANTGLIMAISIIFLPIAISRKQISAKGFLLIGSCAILSLVSLNGAVTIWEGLLLMAVFGLFIFENIHAAKALAPSKEERTPFDKKELPKNILLFVLGAAALVVGSDLLVDNGTFIAEYLGVPERIIAITMVAIGTSLPELVTTITALVKRQGNLSVGNILGANIIDITMILPLCAMVSGGSLPVARASYMVDMPLCFIEAAIAIVPTLILKKFTRVQGIFMLLVYIGYIIFSVSM